MKPEDSQLVCQVSCLRLLAHGVAEVPPQSLGRCLKLAVRRRLSPNRERALKRLSNELFDAWSRFTGNMTRPCVPPANTPSASPRAADLVRVRSQVEIETTLNHWRQLRGCTFMPEMAEYCGTTQQVLRRVERFVDERDLRVKTSRGIILLAGVMCQGTAAFGRCDRSCFYFWREEWLEKVER